jgi:tetratricopeptide (TPR) repeat protein
VYITYSNPLLDSARASVRDILACDALHGGALAGQTASFEELEERGCFRSFREFLRSLLDEESAARFQPGTYVAFPRFRRMWQLKLGAHPDAAVRALGPELSWHVIRTYIKGMRDEDGSYFSPEDYTELPEKRKSVSDANFEFVFTHVWSSWYRHEPGWDDQDLVREVLNRAVADGDGTEGGIEYSAVFCDEAQDFTRIELEFLLNLSVFTRRAVPAPELRLIPFAFAGDPFQTLNPTGFEWQSVRSIFHEHIVRSLDRDGRAKLEFNFQELSYNYRSNDPIVGLCNRLQLVRGIAFGVAALQPQKTWFDEAANNVCVFDVGQGNIEDALRSDAEAVIIVPAHENGEDEFIGTDGLLSGFRQEQGAWARTVLSPMRAKGLEFQRVILYKFGDRALREAPQLLETLSSATALGGDRDRRLQLEYFVNRLYVAASRARSTLLIVDTREAIEAFWRPLGIDPPDEKLLAAYAAVDASAAAGWDEENIGRLYEGSVEQWTSGGDDPLEIAEKFLEQGRAAGDVFLLRRASAIFERHKKGARAKLCDALSSEVEEDWTAAGDAYVELGSADKAVDCYWRALAFEKVVATHGAQPSIRGDAARFFVSGKSLDGAARFLAALVAYLGNTPGAALTLRDDAAMKQCATALVERLGGHTDARMSGDDPAAWAGLWDGLERLGQVGLANLETLPALALAYRAGQHGRVVELWAKAGQGRPMSAAVRDAHAHALPFPARLKYLAELGRWEQIGSLGAANPGVRVSEEDTGILVAAQVRTGRLQPALDLVRSAGMRDPRVLDEILSAARKAGDAIVQRPAGELVLRHSVEDRQWRRAVAVITGQPPLDPAVRALLLRHLVGLLAVSEGLPSTAPEEQRVVQEFLRTEVLGGDPALRAGIPIDELGAALERAGRHVDALGFYESVMQGDWGSGDPVRRFARSRWFVTKERQSTVGASAGRHSDELWKAAERAGISQRDLSAELQRLPRYPRPGELSDAVPAKEQLKAAPADEVFELKLLPVLTGRWLRAKRRINLTADGLVCKIQVSRDRLVCESDDVQISYRDAHDGAGEWQVDPWNLLVRGRPSGDGLFDVSLMSEGAELRSFRF